MAAAVGGVLGGALARWQRPDRLIVGGLALSLIALEGVLFTPPGSALYLFAVAASGALLGLHRSLLIARAQELTPGSESAVAFFAQRRLEYRSDSLRFAGDALPVGAGLTVLLTAFVGALLLVVLAGSRRGREHARASARAGTRPLVAADQPLCGIPE